MIQMEESELAKEKTHFEVLSGEAERLTADLESLCLEISALSLRRADILRKRDLILSELAAEKEKLFKEDVHVGGKRI
jgi:hypothetical protein